MYKLFQAFKAFWLRHTLPKCCLVKIQLGNYSPSPMELFASHAGTLQYLGKNTYWMKTPHLKDGKQGEVSSSHIKFKK